MRSEVNVVELGCAGMFWCSLESAMMNGMELQGSFHSGNDKLISPIMKQFDPTKNRPELLELQLQLTSLSRL